MYMRKVATIDCRQRVHRHFEDYKSRRASVAIEMADKVHDSSALRRLIVVDPSVSSKNTWGAVTLPPRCEWFQVAGLGVLHLAPRQNPLLWLHMLPKGTSFSAVLSNTWLASESDL